MPGKKKMNSSPRQLANLRRFDQMSREEHHEKSVKGGKAAAAHTAEVKRRKRTFREAAEWILSLPAFATDNDAVNAIMEKFPSIDNTQAMTIAVVAKAINEGDVKAYTAIRDTTGELPEQIVNVKNEEPMTINIKTVE